MRWIVLESPPPIENIVAATRLKLPRDQSSAVVDIFTAEIPSDMDAFFTRILAIVRSFGFTSLVIQIPQWRDDLQDWAASNGFEDCGGYEWPQETSQNLLKHTMILEYRVQNVSCFQILIKY